MTDETGKLNVAVIGCGDWGPRHVRNFSANERVDLRVVADLDPEKLAAVAQRFPGVETTTDTDRVMQDAALDAVVIATPTETHYRLSRQALTRGKHVLCEKPLTLCASESEDLCRCAAETGRIMMVGHVFLFNPGIMFLREEMRSGRLGSVCSIDSVRTNLGPFRRDVGCIYRTAVRRRCRTF